MVHLHTRLLEGARAWIATGVDSFTRWQEYAAGFGRATYIVAALGFFAVVILELHNGRKRRLSKLPPGPFQWPHLGSLPNLLLTVGVTSSSRLREKVSELARKHGPLMFLQIADTQILIVSSGKAAKEVLVAQDAEFYFRPQCAVGKYLGFGSSDVAFAEGKHHWHLRKLCDTRLFSADSFASYGHIPRAEALKMLHSVWEASKKGNEISIRETVTAFVRNSLCGMLVGTAHLDIENVSLQFTEKTLIKLLDETISVVGDVTLSDLAPGLRRLDLLSRTRKLKELHERWEKYLRVILEDRAHSLEKSAQPEALVDALLSLDDADMKISKEAIMGVVLDTLVGGIYSTSATIEWALAELVRHPAVLEKVQLEMTEAVGPYHIVEDAEIFQLPYFQATLKETLRLHPAVPMSLPHMNKVTTPISRYQIPANTSVVIDYSAIARDPAAWHKPLRFDPSRFLHTSAASKIDDVFKFLPFGYGRRGCPGANFAAMLLQVALAHLIQAFDWAPIKGQQPHDINVNESPGLICFMSSPLILIATPRLSSSLYQVSP